MLKDELIELAKNTRKYKAEGQTLEVKSAHLGCPKRLYDSLSSFSNQDQGGVILFGLDETREFEIVGVYDPQDLQKKVTEQCLQMEPQVRAFFTIAEIDGKLICSAEIPAVDIADRPCFYRGSGKIKGSYTRVGDADLPMTDFEIYSYEAFRKHLHDDERPVSQASMSLMDQDKMKKYVLEKSIDRPGFSKLSEEQAYEMLALTRQGVPTLAAVMNFCIFPQGYFPQYAITAVVVPGKELGDIMEDSTRFLDNKRIEGTIPEMISEALMFCKRNMKIRTIVDRETGKRTDKTEYPIAALREAILNALIHRDYSIHTEGTPVQIDFFVDRVEVHSPGNLYGRMSVEQLGVAKPDLRNPALAVMTETLTSAEHHYTGIPTMRNAMEEYGLREPVFENRRNEFVVIFYNTPVCKIHTETVETSNAADTLLDYCRIPRSRQEIADYLGVKTAFYAIQHYVRPLLETGELVMTIPDKPKSRNQRFFSSKIT